MRHQLREFGRRRYGSAAAGRRIVTWLLFLATGLLLMIMLWEGTLKSPAAGMVTGGLAGLIGQELLGLVHRHRHRRR